MKINSEADWLSQDIFDVFHMFLQGSKLDEEKPFVNFVMQQNGTELFMKFTVEFDEDTRVFEGFYQIEKYSNNLQEKRYIKRAVKKFLYENLSAYYGVKLPWGSLTGIRPTRVVYERLENGLDKCFIKEMLMKDFCVREDKARLVDRTIKNQTSIIKNEKLIDLYVNIPFCPTKCSYCSFISSEYCKVEKIIPDYINALIKEIRAVKKMIKDKLYIVRSIYIGGGTPSVLEPQDLQKILAELYFDVSEFTVECGRPDTITKEKLDVLKRFGVTRISINPQTFIDATLKRIGRNHKAKDVIEAYKLAIPYDFSINMDLIAGLPGESLRGFKKTIQTVLELYPDNITIHTLALKRGSELVESNAQNENEVTEKMIDFGENTLLENGYKPYYLYKLKNQNAGLENVGYFRDKPCIFNIDSMEETSSIIAMGAGAITKRVFLSENRIERQANCKFAKEYIERVDEMIQKKMDLFSD